MSTALGRTAGLLLVAVLACTRHGSRSANAMSEHRVWTTPLEWRQKPAGIEGEYVEASAIEFEPGGRFRMAGATLLRFRGVTSVSEGDGVVRYQGEWAIANDRVVVKYRVDTPTRLLVRPRVIGTTETEVLSALQSADREEFLFRGRRFVPNATLDSATLRTLFEERLVFAGRQASRVCRERDRSGW